MSPAASSGRKCPRKLKKMKKIICPPCPPEFFTRPEGRGLVGVVGWGNMTRRGARRLRHQTEIRKINGLDPIEVHNVARIDFEKSEA